MYSRRIVSNRLGFAASKLGWHPRPHSLSEVDAFIHKLESEMRLDASGRPYFPRDLTAEEAQFIRNERTMAALDADYFLTRYAWLTDESNTAVRFRYRGAQPILFDVISKLEEAYAPIELIIAKGRQQYVTTITELLDLHRVLFRHYTNCFVASADSSKSAEMMKKALFAYDHLPWWLKPKYSRRVEGIPGLLEFDTLDSRMTVVHGSGSARSKGAQRTGIARGTTPTVYHLSEVSSYPDPEEQIEAAILRSVHASPNVLGILESTFAGDKGWFPEKYKHARAHWDDGTSRFRALFFSWVCAREIYPTPTWWRINSAHKPGDWKPSGKVLEQITKAELFIRADPLLSPYFGPNWIMPISQQWFYHVGFTEAERTGTMAKWLQEVPCDDVEALQSSFDNVFTKEVIEIISSGREKKFDVYGFAGQAIDERFEPPTDQIDYSRPRTVFNYPVPRTGNVYRFELIPLRYDLFSSLTGDDSERESGIMDAKLFVYSHPESEIEYAIGADSSSGVGSDASVINVNRIGLPGTPDVQAAEFRSHLVSHVELFAFVLPIALFFKQQRKDLGSWPRFAVEQVVSVGDVCQNELRKLGYPLGRMHRFARYDGVDMKQVTNKVGWYTTGWSRPILLGHFIHAIKNGWYKLNSPWTIEECREFEVHYTESGKLRVDHSSTSWDDGIFASAISYFIAHDMDSLAERSKRQVAGVVEADNVTVDLAPHPGWIANPSAAHVRQPSLAELIRSMSQSRQIRL